MAAATMRAVRLQEVGRDPVLTDVPVPVPSAGEVRIAMRACGICGSDVHLVEGSTVPDVVPLTLGHEPAGVVDAVGDGVEEVRPGDRVVVNSMISCGSCRRCRRGRPNLCDDLVLMGIQTHGAHAEYFLAPAVNCVPIPEGLGFAESAVATDAVATPLHAIRRSGVGAGDTALVVGVGGLGAHAIMLLTQVFGERVVAVDTRPAALDRARGLGAEQVVDGRAGRVAPTVRDLTDGGVDAAFDFVGSPAVVEQCLRSLHHGGTCVAVGVVPDRLALGVRQETLVARELALTGSFGFLQDDVATALELMAAGTLEVGGGISHRVPLESYADGLAALRDPGIDTTRVVVTHSPAE